MLAKGRFNRPLSGDVVGHAADNRRSDAVSPERVVILPEASFPGARQYDHEAFGLAVTLDTLEVSWK